MVLLCFKWLVVILSVFSSNGFPARPPSSAPWGVYHEELPLVRNSEAGKESGQDRQGGGRVALRVCGGVMCTKAASGFTTAESKTPAAFQAEGLHQLA